MWTFEHVITTEATAESIWKLYSHISSWTAWDQGIERAALYGAIQTGTKGELQPKGKPALEFEITYAAPNQGFSDRTEMPHAGLTVLFDHELQCLDNMTVVKHRVTLTGPNVHKLDPKNHGCTCTNGIGAYLK
jgi:hypothetical protein